MPSFQALHPGPRVLIADDDPDTLYLLQRKMQAEGFHVRISDNASDLYALLEQETPDLILLDICMNAVSGAELCYQLKHDPDTESIPVLLFSAHHRLAQLTEECNADGFLPKPIDIPQLKIKIAEILFK